MTTPPKPLASGKPLSTIELQPTWHPAFYQAVQFVEALADTPGTPHTAAIFALLYQELESPVRTDLVTWLEHYIEDFVSTDPSTQTDQPEKVIAVATYLYLCFDNDVLPRYPYLPYLEYAAKRRWLNDSLLAFMCWQLRNDIELCQQATLYFVDNLNTFVNKKRSRELSQLLLVHPKVVSPYDRDTIVAMLQKTIADPTTSLPNLGWALLALGTPSPSPQPDSANLIEHLYTVLQNTLNTIVRNTKIIKAIAIRWNTPLDTEMRSESTQTNGILIPLTDWGDAPSVAPIDIALVTYALCKTGNHQMVSIPSHAKTDVALALHHYEAHSKGHIFISKLENLLLNLIVLIFTTMGGFAMLLLYSGGKINISGTIDIFNPDLPFFAFILLLVVEIAFTLLNKPITKILYIIPLLGETLRKFSNRKENRT